ncbi:MAG: hypothetical protein ACLTGQ_09170 [Mediterraneibacter gnavus]
MEELYHQWIAKKNGKKSARQPEIDMIDNLNSVFKNLESVRIKSVDEEDIEDFMKCAIKDHELTQKF